MFNPRVKILVNSPLFSLIFLLFIVNSNSFYKLLVNKPGALFLNNNRH
jgi:hypothetical protein